MSHMSRILRRPAAAAHSRRRIYARTVLSPRPASTPLFSHPASSSSYSASTAAGSAKSAPAAVPLSHSRRVELLPLSGSLLLTHVPPLSLYARPPGALRRAPATALYL
mmetsp:Transcript_7899/g.24245  ORF Transcript_7899/g.24245 Transcript_7899/m.24245 type:complete len:108 (-) Transcript_7899:60-383(-)